MKLILLEPRLLKYIDNINFRTDIQNLDDADGIIFLCPKCLIENKGSIGTHSIICWFEDCVPDDIDPKPGRWTPQGHDLTDLTFVPGIKHQAVSIKLTSGCMWHGFIRNGEVI